MEQTPYAPPAAHVSDPVVAAGPRPRSVRISALCLWVSALVGLVSASVEMWPILQLVRTGATSVVALVVTVVTVVVSIGLLVLVAVKIGAGRNWARWFFLVLYVFGTLMWAFMLFAGPAVYGAKSALGLAVEVFQILLQTAAVVLMFVRASNEWFAAMKRSR